MWDLHGTQFHAHVVPPPLMGNPHGRAKLHINISVVRVGPHRLNRQQPYQVLAIDTQPNLHLTSLGPNYLKPQPLGLVPNFVFNQFPNFRLASTALT